MPRLRKYTLTCRIDRQIGAHMVGLSVSHRSQFRSSSFDIAAEQAFLPHRFGVFPKLRQRLMPRDRGDLMLATADLCEAAIEPCAAHATRSSVAGSITGSRTVAEAPRKGPRLRGQVVR